MGISSESKTSAPSCQQYLCVVQAQNLHPNCVPFGTGLELLSFLPLVSCGTYTAMISVIVVFFGPCCPSLADAYGTNMFAWLARFG